MEVVLESPYIFICEKKLRALHDVPPLLEQVAKHGQPLLIISEDVDGEALVALVVNKLRGTLRVAAVKAPGFGDGRKDMLEDLAVLTGGQVFTEDLGMSIQAVKMTDLGRSKRVTIDRNRTTLIEGFRDPQKIEVRVGQIKARMAELTSDYDRKALQERLAQLLGRVAVIRIGAATETEMKEKKTRLDDAIHATKAAVDEGIVPGGGLALLRCIPVLESMTLPADMQIGVNIVRQALETPLRQIAENAGHAGTVVLSQVRQEKWPIGFDAATETYVDMLEAGIVDPTKVTRTALAFAASIAGLMLTTEVMVADHPVEMPDRELSTPDEPAA